MEIEETIGYRRDEKVCSILKSEVERAIKDMNKMEATEEHDVPVDLLKKLEKID